MMNALSANRAMTPLEWVTLLTLSGCLGRVLFLCGPCRNSVAATDHCDVSGGDRQPGLYAFHPPDHATRRTRMDRFFIMGLLNNAIQFSLIVWGQKQISSGQASILNAITPIFTVIVAHLFTRDERMTMRHVLGTGLGFASVVILVGEFVFGGVGDSLMAQAAPLGAAFAYVLYSRILASAGATNLSLVTMLVPPTAILLGILFLSENLQGHHLLGLMLIIAGLMVIDGRVAAFRRDRN